MAENPATQISKADMTLSEKQQLVAGVFASKAAADWQWSTVHHSAHVYPTPRGDQCGMGMSADYKSRLKRT